MNTQALTHLLNKQRQVVEMLSQLYAKRQEKYAHIMKKKQWWNSTPKFQQDFDELRRINEREIQIVKILDLHKNTIRELVAQIHADYTRFHELASVTHYLSDVISAQKHFLQIEKEWLAGTCTTEQFKTSLEDYWGVLQHFQEHFIHTVKKYPNPLEVMKTLSEKRNLPLEFRNLLLPVGVFVGLITLHSANWAGMHEGKFMDMDILTDVATMARYTLVCVIITMHNTHNTISEKILGIKDVFKHKHWERLPNPKFFQAKKS